MNYYNKKYFDWQIKAGMYGAQQDLWMYEQFIRDESSVLDFGCGGGYMLAKLKCKYKYGVDVNPIARKVAGKKGITVYKNLNIIPKNLKFDAVISHHTLEHVDNPYKTLTELKVHLKKNGMLICVLPIDDWRIEKKYNPNDINQHLYTWTPLLAGNLFAKCGFKIKEIKIIERSWIPLSSIYYNYVPGFIYNFFSMIWSKLTLSRQIRVVAHLLILFYFNTIFI